MTVRHLDGSGFPRGFVLVDEDGSPLSSTGKVLVGTAQDRIYDQFRVFAPSADPNDATTDWWIAEQGAGMTIPGVAGGAAAGTTPYGIVRSAALNANQRLVLVHKTILRPPFHAKFAISAESRIAGTSFLIGFVQCDPVTGAIVTDSAIVSVPELLNARNAVAFRLDGTSATVADLLYRAAGGGLYLVNDTAYSGFTSAAAGTAPNLTVADQLLLDFDRDGVNARSVDFNSTSSAGGTVQQRNDAIPNPTETYRLFVAVISDGTGPASQVDYRLHFVNVVDSVRFDTQPRFPGINDVSRAVASLIIGTLPAIVGQAAHDAVVSGSPVRVAGRGHNAYYTPVASGDVADIITDLRGRVITRAGAPRELLSTGTITLTTTTETTLVAAGGTGVFLDAHFFVIANTSATAVRVDLRPSTGGTVAIPVQVPAGQTVVVAIGEVPWPQAASNNNWTAQLSAAVTDVRIAAIMSRS
jgi:hypothetical protein